MMTDATTKSSNNGKFGHVTVALFALILSGSALHGAGRASVLGTGGDVYQVAVGNYGELFPSGAEASAAVEVVRLEVRRGSGGIEHYLVPGSGTDDHDEMPSLFFDSSTGRLHVVWSSNNASTLSRINLASFDGSEWSDTIEVSGNIYSNKSAPRLAVTHDLFKLAAGDESNTRTVLHIVWSEDTTSGPRAMYAPVVLIDGELASTWRRVHRLNDYVSQKAAVDPFVTQVPPHLLRAPTVDAASEANAIVIAFADGQTGSLVQLELATPAAELSELADSLAEFLANSNLCRRIDNEGSSAIASVASAARHHLVLVGRRITRRALAPMAIDINGFLTERAKELCAEGGLNAVAIAARHHLVLVGARAQAGDLLETAETADGHVLLAAAQPVGDGYVQHLARLQVKSERAAPAVGSGEPTIFVSPTGTGAVVAWENESALKYVETTPDAEAAPWSAPFTLRIGDSLSRAEAYSILRERARSLDQ